MGHFLCHHIGHDRPLASPLYSGNLCRLIAHDRLQNAGVTAKDTDKNHGGQVSETATAMSDAGRDAEFTNAHARLIADKSMQFELPAYSLPEIPSWIKPTGEFFKWLLPATPYLFWGAVALGVALIAWFIYNEARGLAFRWPWQQSPVADEEQEWTPDQSAARALLADAEALAAAGHYAAAARLLLQRSVEDIARRRPEFLKPSVTARDISVADAIPGTARKAFAAIARVVEVSAFGSASVNADAWADCRAAYSDFALAGSWRG